MSVRKRSWTNKSGIVSERWVCCYTDGSGIRRERAFKLKRDADAFAAATAMEVINGVHTPASVAPTIQKAAEQWIDDCTAAGLERSTLTQYHQHLRLHIVPNIGGVKLSAINVPFIMSFKDTLAKNGTSPALIKKIIVSLGSIIATAKERGQFAGNNPVREMSRGKKSRQEKRHSVLEVGVDIPTKEEVKRLLEHVPESHPPIIMLAVFTGLRASELRGLRWTDIDFKSGQVTVSQRADRYQATGKPKSRSGNRTIPIPPALLTRLKAWRLACPVSKGHLVFPTSKGEIIDHKSLTRKYLNPVMVAAGLVSGTGSAKYTMHSLRHWFASWCCNLKVDGGRELPLKTIQTLMGHATITITATTYSHLFARGDDAAELAAAEKGVLG